jgi:UDPglucose 6-dehydrogenase
MRDAPSLQIAERLLQMDARVRAFDPIAMQVCKGQRPDLKIRYCDSPEELAAGCDALVVVTEWQQFRSLDLAQLAQLMSMPILVDGRNLFTPEEASAAGLDYTGIGRCPRPRPAVARPLRRAASGSAKASSSPPVSI